MNNTSADLINENIINTLNTQLSQKNIEVEQLLARIAHELLTPITALLMSSEELMDHYVQVQKNSKNLYTNDELLVFTKRINKNGKDLRNQIGEVLNHFSPNEISIKPTSINVYQAIEELLEQFIPELDKEMIKYSITSTSKNIRFFTNEIELKTILRNLISNAVKFTIANKELSSRLISIDIVDTVVDIKVIIKDSGIGMNKEFYQSGDIFNLGKRAENAKKKEVRGYGLGLSTTFQLVKAINSSIKYESKINEGTTVELTLSKEVEEFTI